MEIWSQDIKRGIEMGLNDNGELFLQNMDGGINYKDTPKNRKKLKRDYYRMIYNSINSFEK